MLISLEKRKFIIGKFEQVIEVILDQPQKNISSKIILPCSLHDLAIQNNRINQSFYQEVDFCTSDSMFLTNYLRHKYHKQIERVYGPELMLAILKQKQATSSKDKHYFLAANKKSMLALQKIHQKKYSLVPAVFDFLPYNINQQTETKYLKKIVMAKPQFIWLGIGSPKQVQLASWLKKHQLSALIICVGAAFDFVSHSKKQAPSWIRKNNLEWLFRLITEPKRLWRRYLIVIPKYLLSLLWKKL